MAIVFNTTQYSEIDQAVITAYPFTMACWFQAANVTIAYTLMFIGDKDATNHFTALHIRGDLAGDPVSAFSHSYGAASSQKAETSTGYSASTWHHACGIWASASSRAAYLDGGGKTTDTNAVGAMANHDRTAIGASRDSSPSNHMGGYIAEAAIWNVALTDAEVAVLAAGYSPLFVRPESLVSYLPLIRDGHTTTYDDAKDIIGGLTFTSPLNPDIISHPRIYHPAPPPIVYTSTPRFDVGGGIFLYTATNWPTKSWYFEVDMRATVGTARARLWDITAGAAVAGSDITTSSGSFARLRSSALTLTDGNEYRAEFGSLGASAGESRGAVVIGI